MSTPMFQTIMVCHIINTVEFINQIHWVDLGKKGLGRPKMFSASLI